MTDLWLLTYERAFSEFDADRQTIGDAAALTEFMRKMRALGFEHPDVIEMGEAML